MAAITERLLLSCRDRSGIVATITAFLARVGANISELDQFSDFEEERFAIRVEYTLPRAPDWREDFVGLARDLDANYHFCAVDARPGVAILCSRQDHCLMDLVWRFANDELAGHLTDVISTVPDHASKLSAFDVAYHTLTVTDMTGHERAILELLQGRVQLVVLARYMRILSADFLREIGCPVINIHHSFLPAFVGADPYARAHERGVKLIGATAHYVNAELDAGPIIEQDVARVTHRDQITDLRRIGRDVERLVLARAVRAHLEDRVVTWGNRTIVF
jgi:formyltetrahydrofolate deformylase